LIGFIGQKATAAPDHFEKEHKQPTLPGVGLPNRIGQSTGASPFGRPCVHVGGSKPSMEKLIVELARFFLYRPSGWPVVAENPSSTIPLTSHWLLASEEISSAGTVATLAEISLSIARSAPNGQ